MYVPRTRLQLMYTSGNEQTIELYHTERSSLGLVELAALLGFVYGSWSTYVFFVGFRDIESIELGKHNSQFPLVQDWLELSRIHLGYGDSIHIARWLPVAKCFRKQNRHT